MAIKTNHWIWLIPALALILTAGCQPAAPAGNPPTAAQPSAPAGASTATSGQPATSAPSQAPASPTTAAPSPTTLTTRSPTQDQRIIADGAENFLPRVQDLPAEGRFYLPSRTLIGPVHNPDILKDWGLEPGNLYVNQTRRIDGWKATYLRGSEGVNSPQKVTFYLDQHKDAVGALKAIDQFRPGLPANPGRGWTSLPTTIKLGDLATASVRKQTVDDRLQVTYRIDFASRNFAAAVEVSGAETDASLEWTLKAAEMLANRLKTARLVDP
jgi:hypothetical protein